MPTYEYRCACGNEFEVFQGIMAKPAAKCPECGRKAQRLISGGTGLIFKGSGFYITDYKNNGHASGGPGQSKAGDESAPSETKAEAKSSEPKSGESSSSNSASGSKTSTAKAA